MPEEIKKDDNVVEKRESVEVLDANGGVMTRDTPLADIFQKIEDGKEEGKSAADVIKESKAPKQEESAQPVKKKEVEEKKPEAKVEEVKTEVKTKDTLDDALSRESLRKQQTEVPAEVKTEEKETEAKTEDSVPDEELQVLPHDKPKTAKRIQALLKKIDQINSEVSKTKQEATEKATKLAELEKKLGEVKTVDPVTEEAVKKQIEELGMFKRRYQLESDPEVKTKFDSRVESAEASITDTLKRRGLADSWITAIKEEGGWNKFADSSRVFSLAEGKTATAQEIAEMVLQNLPLGERKNVEAAMMEQVQTKREKDRFFKEEQEKATEFFKKQDEEVKKQQQSYQASVQELAGKVQVFEKQVLETNDWMKEKEVPGDATAEQKLSIQEDNKYAKQLQGLLKKTLASRDVNESLEVIYDSMRYYNELRNNAKMRAENVRLAQQLAAKQAEIDRYKTGGRTVTKPGSLVGGTVEKVSEKKAPASLEEALAALERGDS